MRGVYTDTTLKTLSLRLLITVACVPVIWSPGYSQNADSTAVFRLDSVEVTGDRPIEPAATKSFSARDISTSPGSMNDPMRTLDVSGEVISNSDLQAFPIIAGDQADAILTLVDGFPVTYPYRLLGSFSLFSPLTTSSVSMMTAGYPAVYGGYAPTAVSVKSDAAYSSRPNLATDVSPFASSLAAKIPISEKLRWSAKVALRGSHIGLAAGLLPAPSRRRLESFMPSMMDGQAFMNQVLSENLLSFQEGLVSSEHGSLASNSRSFDYNWQKGFAGAALISSSSSFSSEHRISYSFDRISLSTVVPIEFVGSGRFGINSRFASVRLQDQFHFPVLPAVTVAAGTDIVYSASEVGLETFSSWLNGRSPLRSSFADVSGYTELKWLPADRMSLTAGIRGSYFGFLRQTGVEPRLTLEYDFPNRGNVRLSLGQYLQALSDFEILHGFLMFLSEPDQTPLMMLMSQYRDGLRPETHNLAAVNGTVSVLRSSFLKIDGRGDVYYKMTGALAMPERYPSIFTPLDTMSYRPSQDFRGIRWGMGVSTVAAMVPLHLSLSASLFSHHSRIVDLRTFEQYNTIGDIPAVAKFLLRYAPPGWTLSILYQYSIGAPTTDGYYLKGSNLIGSVVYLPVWRTLNSDRVPDYHRLDIAVAKSWQGTDWKIDAVIGVLNVLGNQNISSYMYPFSEESPDYVRKAPVVNTLPMVPNIEIRCEYSL